MPPSPPLVHRPNTGPAVGATALTAGVTTIGGRAFLISATSSGNVTVEFADTSTATIAIPAAGVYEFNWAIIQVVSTTVSGNFYNLY